MSNFLAVATVTATLRRILQASLDVDVPGAAVGTARPDGDGGSTPPMGVNIYLFQVTPSAAWRNADLPTRDSDGNVRQRPTAALELHYLLTFHGDDGQLEPQRVLGSVVRSLHERPLLTRQMILDTLQSPTFNYLAASNLADQVERVKFTPTALTLEEFSKLWSVFFQIPYTLSVAYQGSVVLIDGDSLPHPVLPVLKSNLQVIPFLQPFIEEILPEPPQSVESGGKLTIRGQNFNTGIVRINFGGTEVPPNTLTNTQFTVAVPAGLTAGVRSLQVVQLIDYGSGSSSEPHRGFESNVAVFILAPKILLPQPLPPQPVLGTVVRGSGFTINVAPPVSRNQDVRLLVGDETILLPTRLPTDPPLLTNLTFTIPADFPTGQFMVRLQVDGAQSSLSDKNSAFDGPQLSITAGSHSLRTTIEMASSPSGMAATVSVSDETGAAVPSAEVSVTWTLPDSTMQPDIQLTNTSGIANFTIPGNEGSYSIAITAVTKQGYSLDQLNSTIKAS
jgi:hypothetical protein